MPSLTLRSCILDHVFYTTPREGSMRFDHLEETRIVESLGTG